MLLCVSAAPATKPATATTTYKKLEDIIQAIPKNLRPVHNEKWTEIQLDLASKWLHDNVSGSTIELPAFPVMVRVKKKSGQAVGARCDFFYLTKRTRGERYDPVPFKAAGYTWSSQVVGMFDGPKLEKLSKLHVYDSATGRLGDKVILSGPIKDLQLNGRADAGAAGVLIIEIDPADFELAKDQRP